jgi:hypothetical protein
MQRIIMNGVLVAGIGSLLLGGIASAEEQAATSAAPAAEAPAASPSVGSRHPVALSREVIDREEAIVKWRERLGGSRWDLTLRSGGERPGQAMTEERDVLTFDRRKVGSDILGKAGHEPAEYSLYGPSEKIVSWEAMERKDEKGAQETLVWRGEINGETMQGTLMKRIAKGAKETVQNFSFTGRLVKPETAAPAEATPDPVTTAPVQ